MGKIALVRHGETDWNKKKIIQGRIDNPLNDLGKSQACNTAKHFKEGKWDIIIASPLIRAAETAKIISENIGYFDKVILDEAFIERNFGEADGKTISEYYDRVFTREIEGLELEHEIQMRMMNGIKKVIKQHKDKNIIIVCHSHSIKATLSYLKPHEYNFRTKLSNCSITILNYENEDILIEKANYNDYI